MKGFNLSTYFYTDRKITYSLYVASSFLVFLLTVYNVTAFMGLKGRLQTQSVELSDVKRDINLLRKELASKGTVSKEEKAEMKGILDDIDEINAIIEKESFSWSELLYSLEKAAPRGISIKNIKPSYGSKKIKISGTAKTLNDVTTLVDNLHDTAYISKSFLLSESLVLYEKKYPARSFNIEAEGKF